MKLTLHSLTCLLATATAVIAADAVTYTPNELASRAQGLPTPRPTFAVLNTLTAQDKADGWHLLFDGKSLDGWKITTENPSTFAVKDGVLVVDGPRAHAFYAGPVGNADFKNFELRMEIFTYPIANSGVYFHTAYQESGWPSKGYEVQVNNTHTDKRKLAGLYAIQDNEKILVPDETWFELRIRVVGKLVQTWVNGQMISNYVEEANPARPDNMKGRVLDRGTIAIQGHDPKSRILYRNIAIKLLP